ncbi:MAG: ABC transporter substrate-binding protein [Candidatus Dependentiae bacterium]|nr:ABC transporter substrate-binding protein [Candidatus Dependentiae bacterium]
MKTLEYYRSWYATIPEMSGFGEPGTQKPYALNDPPFADYFVGYDTNFFRLIGIRIGLFSPPWDPTQLREPLGHLVKRYRESGKYVPEQVLPLEKGDRLIIIGTLHASIFSLMRDLDELEKRGLIDNQCTLADRTHLLFLGDLFNYSPHSFELLDLVLTLLERNPGRAFCLRGDQEMAARWENFAAARDPLSRWQRLWGHDAGVAELKDGINALFAAFPERIIIRQKDNPIYKILCSGREPQLHVREAAELGAIIMGERRNAVSWDSKGLEFFGFNKGVAFWSLTSCPNRFYRDLLRFHHDAFAIMTIGPSVAETVLEFSSRDVLTSESFTREEFSVMFGFSLLQGDHRVLKSPILKVGSTEPLTAQLGGLGQGLKSGIETAIMRANRQGGCAGMLIHPIILDDFDLPGFAQKNVRKLKKYYGVKLLLCDTSTPTLLSYLDKIRAGEFDLFFPVTGGYQFRRKDLSHIINLRKSYPQESISAVDFMIDVHRISNFAIIYPLDPYGTQLAKAAREQLKKRGVTRFFEIPFTEDNLLSPENIKKIRNMGPGSVGFFFNSVTRATTFLSQVGANFLIDKYLFTVSIVDVFPFRLYVETRGLKFNFSCVLQNPAQGNIPLIREYIQEMEKQHHPTDITSLEGYVAASLFLESIRHADQPITGAKLMHWLESLREFDFKGLTLTFHPETRSFEVPGWIRTEKGEWFRA